MLNDFEMVKSFLDSIDGQEWLLNNHDVLTEIHNYISEENSTIDKYIIQKLIKFFPEFKYLGIAYRFIASPQDVKLIWIDSETNISWSKNKATYQAVLKSLSIKNHQVQVYQAFIEGLDLELFLSVFKDYFPPFLSSFNLVETEKEILAVNFSNLELIESK